LKTKTGRNEKNLFGEAIRPYQRRSVMTQPEKKSFSDKHAPQEQIDESIAKALSEKQTDGEISCAAAFGVSDALAVPPPYVGKTIDLMNLKLVKCQLGLFGYKPEKKVVQAHAAPPLDLVNAIRKELVQERLPCKNAWQIASRFSVSKMTVSSVCETEGIKIKPCQLGAF
jgi:hypothetical protein